MSNETLVPRGAQRRAPVEPEVRRHLLLLLLAVNSGAVDAIGLGALGGVFTSVMTGNMIFLGTSLAAGAMSTALRAVLAIVLFMAGAFLGARIAGRPSAGQSAWPSPITKALSLELVLSVAFAACWWSAGTGPDQSMQWVMLGIDALALGVQSSAILRFGLSGLSTTYMTGTLTTLVAALAHGQHPRNVTPSMRILMALVAGAAIALVVLDHARMLVPLVSLIPVGLTVALGRACAS